MGLGANIGATWGVPKGGLLCHNGGMDEQLRARIKAAYAAMPDELRAFYRACNARRRKYARYCDDCGAPMIGIASARYCSGRCAKRASRARLKAAGPTSRN
jgi:hypothetical protein